VPGVVLGAMRRVMRTAMIVVRWASAGPRSQGLRGLRGFVRLNFRVANIAESVRYRRNVRNVLNRTKT